jgi:hypothetical protein
MHKEKLDNTQKAIATSATLKENLIKNKLNPSKAVQFTNQVLSEL